MTRKLLMIGIALVGLTLALGSNAWAEHGRGGYDRRGDNGYHQNDRTPPGHHYGWEKGRGNPHRKGYPHRTEYRHRDQYRHHPPKRVEKHIYHHSPRYDRRIVEKHVYHHYRGDDGCDRDRINVAVSVVDRFFGVAVAVSGRR